MTESSIDTPAHNTATDRSGVAIHIRSGLDKGELWVDDVKFISDGKNLIKGGDFEGGQAEFEKNWHTFIKKEAGVVASVKVENGRLHFNVKKAGESMYFVHIYQTGHTVEKGKTYTISARMRASSPRKVDFLAVHQGAPWTIYSTVTPKAWREIELAAAAGIHFHSFGLRMPWQRPNEKPDFSAVRRRMDEFLKHDPEGLVVPRIGMEPPEWWRKANPDECMVFDDGTLATIFASDAILMEDSAVQQLRDAASLEPVVAICATPDIHQGYGVPIGCVMGMDGAIMPAAVGYDINCGMRMITTPLSRGEVDVKSLIGSIARDIPLGEGKHNIRLTHEALERVLRRGVPAVAELLDELPQRIGEAFDAEEFQRDLQAHEDGGSLAGDPAAISQRAYERGAGQLATLGGGNHFIELQYVEQIYDADAAEKLGVHPTQAVRRSSVHAQPVYPLLQALGSQGLAYQPRGLSQHLCQVHLGDHALVELQEPSVDDQVLGAETAAGGFSVRHHPPFSSRESRPAH